MVLGQKKLSEKNERRPQEGEGQKETSKKMTHESVPSGLLERGGCGIGWQEIMDKIKKYGGKRVMGGKKSIRGLNTCCLRTYSWGNNWGREPCLNVYGGDPSE